jgi:hypothetical protein
MSAKLNHARVLGRSYGIGLVTAAAATEVTLPVTTPFATGSTVRVDGGGAIA